MTKREHISKRIRFEVFKRDSFTCQYCGGRSPDILLVIDHVDPVANGGNGDILNLVTSCEPCNSGKGARELSEHTELNKQRNQLSALNEKREQLKLMLEWRKEIANLEQEKVTAIVEQIEVLAPIHQLNDNGIKSVSQWLKKYNLEEILDSLNACFEKYYSENEDFKLSCSNFETAFNSVEKVIRWKRIEARDPQESKIRYIAGICANKFGASRRWQTIDLLRVAISKNIDLLSVERLAKESGWWSAFRSPIEQFIKDQE